MVVDLSGMNESRCFVPLLRGELSKSVGQLLFMMWTLWEYLLIVRLAFVATAKPFRRSVASNQGRDQTRENSIQTQPFQSKAKDIRRSHQSLVFLPSRYLMNSYLRCSTRISPSMMYNCQCEGRARIGAASLTSKTPLLVSY